jgi:hypothetical protein
LQAKRFSLGDRGPAAAQSANKVKLAHSGIAKRNRRVTHLRAEQAKSAGMPGGSPDPLAQQFP